MTLPPLYKYLDAHGAKLTLENRSFKHSKPSDFNDIEDLTVQSIFPDETEIALQKLTNGFTDVILQHLEDQPTCSSPMKEKVALIQYAYRNNPTAAEVVKSEVSKTEVRSIYDIENMREQAKNFLREINDFMQDYRVMCVTTLKDSDEMWSNYADAHKGAALRIEPNIAKDSKFQLFRPVEYREARPPFYDDTMDYVAGSLFGDQEARRIAAIEKIVYSKTLEWRHEAEYRLAIPLLPNEPRWNTLKYFPEEVTELYLGCAMTREDKNEIVSMARRLNPKIEILSSRCSVET